MPDDASNCAQMFREQARCRRLADAVLDREVSRALLELAIEFEEQAAVLDARWRCPLTQPWVNQSVRTIRRGVYALMHSPSYYRDQAERAQRLARSVTDRDDGVKAILSQVAQEYEELAEDLEGGAVEIRHPELALEAYRRRSAYPAASPRLRAPPT